MGGAKRQEEEREAKAAKTVWHCDQCGRPVAKGEDATKPYCPDCRDKHEEAQEPD